MAEEPAVATDQSGRRLGPRALQTRQRLLAATEQLLGQRPVRDIAVVEIARKAGTSPATFYQYFKDVTEATLHLAEQAAEDLPPIALRVAGSWEGGAGLDTARGIVGAFVHHWETRRAVLLLRNLASDQGDERFRQVRRETHAELLRALARRVQESIARGRVSAGTDPIAAAGAMVSMLERLGAHQRGLEPYGVSAASFAETAARILYQTVTGRVAPDG